MLADNVFDIVVKSGQAKRLYRANNCGQRYQIQTMALKLVQISIICVCSSSKGQPNNVDMYDYI